MKFVDIYNKGKVVGYVKHDPTTNPAWTAIGVNHRIATTSTKDEAERMVIEDYEINA
jgi:hypothetical protein